MEAEAAEMEKRFAENTDPELYRQYDALTSRIAEMYDLWAESEKND